MTKLRRNSVSPDEPYAVIAEREPDLDGAIADVTTVFLTASECPIGCSMCDLWQNTLEHPTPSGAIVNQLNKAMTDHPRANRSGPNWIKLYNSGNFFDPNSIPPSDYLAIAKKCEDYQRVIVENHPKFGRKRCLEFKEMLAGQLEVAVGLETVQPRWLSRMNKQMSRDSFDDYARWLASESIDLRVFLIVGVPGVSPREAMRWCRLSVRHALHYGARHISLIPGRKGNGWGQSSGVLPQFWPKDYAELQALAIKDSLGRAIVTVDLWDLKREHQDDADAETIRQMSATNLSQKVD